MYKRNSYLTKLVSYSLEDLVLPFMPFVDAPKEHIAIFAKGVSKGCAFGKIFWDYQSALKAIEAGESIIYVHKNIKSEDLAILSKVKGIISIEANYSSHVSIVARTLGIPLIAGIRSDNFDGDILNLNGSKFRQGEDISINGFKGICWKGKWPIVEATMNQELISFLTYCDELRQPHLAILANAESKTSICKAFENGAQGIGICRTEHMFLEKSKLTLLQQLLLNVSSLDLQIKQQFIACQRKDFQEILQAANGHSLNIRLLDAPFHEFASHHIKEENPMMGLRGIRLGIFMKWIYEFQLEALFQALENSSVVPAHLEITVPLVSLENELKYCRGLLDSIQSRFSISSSISMGCMIETPRAALISNDLAREVDFFSFGTNDLTQLTWGLSRDDLSKTMMPLYQEEKIITEDPFEIIDINGVGRLIEMSCQEGKKINPSLKLGLCGEQAYHEKTIKFCIDHGFNYISCSPDSLIQARIASAKYIAKQNNEN